jgi:hypothetical protein
MKDDYKRIRDFKNKNLSAMDCSHRLKRVSLRYSNKFLSIWVYHKIIMIPLSTRSGILLLFKIFLKVMEDTRVLYIIPRASRLS